MLLHSLLSRCAGLGLAIGLAAGCASNTGDGAARPAAAKTGAAVTLPPPPVAPSRPAEETLHGVTVVDPYRNLEDLNAPETRAWLQAEGRYAADALARIEGRDALAERIAALGRTTGDSVRDLHRLASGRLVYLLRRAGENQYKLVVRDGLDAEPRVLVDPEALARSTGVPQAINYLAPSWDGTKVAYGISSGGSEEASLLVVDTASGRALGEPIPRVHEGPPQWSPDSRTLTFNQVRELAPGTPATETFLDSTVYRWAPGDAGAKPVALFGPLVNRDLGLVRLDVAQIFFAPDSRWMVARTTDTTHPEGRIFVAPLAELGRGAAATIRWRRIATAADQITDVQLAGDTLYLRTHAGAPRGRIRALALARAGRLADAVDAVREAPTGVIERFEPAPGGAVRVEVRSGFTTRVLRVARGTPAGGADVAPELGGSTLLATVRDDLRRPGADLWVRTASWTEPPRILAVGAGGKAVDTRLRVNPPIPDAPAIEATEVLVDAGDGARVPLAILRKRDLPQQGRSPTLLIGYGAYGLTWDAGFDPRAIAWLERGGVLALANPRGSGAFGEAWHLAGFKTTKSNTWKDGIACARWLISQGITRPDKLGIWGTSAGGVFVGRAVTTAPDLFAAGIFDVGLLDSVRAERSANGITNVSEFGTVEKPDEFKALLEMSTYAHIEKGVAYPGVLLIHGLNDPRVDVWHSAKTAAKLQAANPGGRPVLLRLDEQAGHGIGSTVRQYDSKLADVYGFLLWQFGEVALRR